MNLEGLDQVDVDKDAGRVNASFKTDLYPVDAIYGAAYIFIDRCYVFLDQPEAGVTKVSFQGRDGTDEATLQAIAGEFANELLSQAWRARIAEQNKPIIEAVAAQALAGAAGPPGLDELDDMDFNDESFEDPLGIAMSWEEKYGKEPADAPTVGEPKGPPPPDGDEAKAEAAGESDADEGAKEAEG